MRRRVNLLFVVLCLVLVCGCGATGSVVVETAADPGSIQETATLPAIGDWQPEAFLFHPSIPTPAPITLDLVSAQREPDVVVAAHDYAKAARQFDAENALGYVRDLTADAYAGRQGGSETGRLAAEYIAERFAEFGLQPAGQDGYLQPVPLPYAQVLEVPTLSVTVHGDQTDLVFGQEFRPWWGGYAGGGVAEGDLFWLNEGGADQYVGADLVGRVGLVRGRPDEQVVRLAMEHGLSGLLAVVDEAKQVQIRRTYRESPYLCDTLPVALVTADVLPALLQGSGYSVSDLSILFDTVVLSAHVRLEIVLDELGTVWGQNVLGVLPGADPDQADRVLVLGGHYDHVGLDPNGDLYAGANDNASGVAVLLEIARLWQELGYVPDCTVLFAAWDGEEQGLLGAIHYVQHPTLPLDQTVAMVQLDMVGLATQGVLTIDGIDQRNVLAEQLAASCDLFGVPTAPTLFRGRSDHEPFMRARIPAVLLIWDNGQVPYYHTPQDTWDTLEVERLQETGMILAHTSMVLASERAGLSALIRDYQWAINRGDLKGAGLMVDPTDDRLQIFGSAWLASKPESVWSTLELSAEKLTVGDGRATAQIRATAEQDGQVQQVARYDQSLVLRDGQWFFGWPTGSTITSTHLTAEVSLADGTPDDWLDELDSAYTHVAGQLGVGEVSPLALTVHRDQANTDWFTEGVDSSALSATHVARTQELTQTAVSLVLADWGLVSPTWMHTGLYHWLARSGDDLEIISHLLLAEPDDVGRILYSASVQTETELVLAESLVDHLVAHYGLGGLQAMARAWGAYDVDAGLAALGTTADSLARDWQAETLQPLLTAQEGLEEWATACQQAVLADDHQAFALLFQDAGSSADLAKLMWDSPSFSATEVLEIEPALIRLTEDGLLARVEWRVERDGAAERHSTDLLFARTDPVGETLVLIGPEWEAEVVDRLLVYRSPSTQSSNSLETLDAIWVRVSAALGVEPSPVLSLYLYEDDDVLDLVGREDGLPMAAMGQSSPALHMVSASLTLFDENEIASSMAEALLVSVGDPPLWLLNGLVCYAADPDSPHWATEGALTLRDVARLDDLDPLALFADGSEVSEQDADLVAVQSEAFVREVAFQGGAQTLRALVERIAQGDRLDAAFEHVIGRSLAEWELDWHGKLVDGAVPQALIESAQTYSPEHVMAMISRLAAPDMQGRCAGSDGAERAAEIIAAEMGQLGIEPAAEEGYLIGVPVQHGALVEMPVLKIAVDGSPRSRDLRYVEQWREIIGGQAGGGEVASELVWLPNGPQEGMDLGGRIAVWRVGQATGREAGAALNAGAGGAILVVKYLRGEEMPQLSARVSSRGLPVARIEEDTWLSLITDGGLTAYDLNVAPPALLTGLSARLSVPWEPLPEQTAYTVIGTIAGTDPSLPPLVLAAHYDGVGSLPDGSLYPGANKGVSGIATMLEIAGILGDYQTQPERTVYFCALGAEMLDHASLEHLYASDLGATIREGDLLLLDTLGQARSYWFTVDLDRSHSDWGHQIALAGELLDRRVSIGVSDASTELRWLRAHDQPSSLFFWPNADRVYTPDDTVDSIDPDKLATSGEIIALTVLMLIR